MELILGLFREDCLSLYRTNGVSLKGKMKIAYPRQWRHVKLLGSCYPFLCIANVAEHEVAIWEPFSDRLRVLPPADAERPHRLGLVVYGFGYDKWNGENFLLRVVQTWQRSIVSEVSIYRKTANTWRQLQVGLPYYLVEPGRMGVHLHSLLYWIMRRERVQNSAKVLVAFNIKTESFVEVNLPNVINNRLRMDLAAVEDSLCLTIYGEAGGVDVWIWRGLTQAWDLLFSLHGHWWSFRPVRPMAYSQTGRRVLVEVGSETKTLGWYNLHTNEAEQFQLNGMPSSFDGATCLWSTFDRSTHSWLRF